MKTNQAVVVRRPRIGVAIMMIISVSVFGAVLNLKAQSSNSPVVVTLPVGTTPHGLVVSPDGTHVYVANLGSNDISVIDVATNQVEATRLPAGPHPSDVRITPDGQYLYVTNELQTGATVSVIQVSTGALIRTITGLGTFPTALAISPSGKFIYVTNAGSGTVSIINTATNQVAPTSINVGPYPEVVAFTPDGRFADVGNYSSNSISFVSTATNQSVGSLLTQGAGPDGISITPDGKKAYVENYGNNGSGTTVSVVQTYMPKVVKTISVGPGPSQSAITPDGNYLFVPLQGANSGPPTSNSVVVIDTRTDTVTGRPIFVGNAPGNVAITPDGKYAYVTNGDDNTVSVIAVARATGPFYTFRDLGTLGGKFSEANGLNNDGVVVGEAEDIKGHFYAFRFANGLMQNLGVPSTDKQSKGDFASAVNNVGAAVGTYSNTHTGSIHACIFANGNVTDVGSPGDFSSGNGINDQGWIVGSVFNFTSQDYHAFLFRPGDSRLEDLGTLGGTGSDPSFVDNLGIITGFSRDAMNNVVPFFAQASTNTPKLIALPTLAGPPFGIAQGSAELPGEVVAVGVSGASIDRAVKWSLTTNGYPITDLGTLPGSNAASAYSINSTGQIVGFSAYNNGAAGFHAFVFENGFMKDLNNLVNGLPSGWSLQSASAINDYGQICGKGTTPDGSTHAFALSPTRPNILVGTLNGSPYEKVYFLSWVSYSHFVPLTDGAVASNEQPTASILWGTTHARRQIWATFSSATNPAGFAIAPASDRFTLQGTGGDMYVLQESFNPKDPYVVAIGASNMRLLWLNPATQSLENAVTASTGTTNKPFFKLGAFNPETDFHLGTYGVDPLRNVVWAVINHD
jgi:YVTN family beta-propeller protein/probable HAF family extracellular repeat protein